MFSCISRATSCEEIGNDIYPDSKKVLKKHNITIEKHSAKQITYEEYNKYNLIIVMEEKNKVDLIKKFGDNNKIHLLLEFTNNKKNIEDPWYTGRFEEVYEQINEGCIKLFNYLIKCGEENGKQI